MSCNKIVYICVIARTLSNLWTVCMLPSIVQARKHLYTQKYLLLSCRTIFSISFSLQLDNATQLVNVSPFRNAGLSFIKTMVMTIGEFEYDNIFGHSNDSSRLLTSFPEVAYILWIVFLIVMPILVTNLLVREGMIVLPIFSFFIIWQNPSATPQCIIINSVHLFSTGGSGSR